MSVFSVSMVLVSPFINAVEPLKVLEGNPLDFKFEHFRRADPSFFNNLTSYFRISYLDTEIYEGKSLYSKEAVQDWNLLKVKAAQAKQNLKLDLSRIYSGIDVVTIVAAVEDSEIEKTPSRSELINEIKDLKSKLKICEESK